MKDWGQFIILLMALAGCYGFIRSDMSAIESRLGGRLDRNADAISQVGEELALLRGDVALLGGDVDLLRGDVDLLREDVAHLEGYVRGRLDAAAQEAAPEPMEYRLYVANESSDIVSRVVFRPGAGAEVEKEIPVGIMPADNDGAHGLTVSPDGAFWYLTIAHGTPYGYVWKFAAGADTLVSRAELGLFPATMGVTPNGQFLVVANFNLHGDMVPSDLSVVYTPTMTQLSRVTTCLMPHGSRVSASGGLQYSACMHSDQLVEFDLTTLEVSRRFSLAPGREGPLDARDQGMGAHVMVMSGAEAADPAGSGGAGAAGTEPGQASSMRDETSMGRMAGMADAVCSPTWAEPGAGALADRVVYVACNRNDEILEIDAGDWTVRRRFATGAAPYNLDVTPDGSLLVATLKGEQAVAVISLESGEELARIATTQPITHGVVTSPDGRYAFVSNEAIGATPGTLDVFDLSALERVASAELRYQPGGIDFWRATAVP